MVIGIEKSAVKCKENKSKRFLRLLETGAKAFPCPQQPAPGLCAGQPDRAMFQGMAVER